MSTVTASLAPYVGSEKCRVGSIYGGKKCLAPATVVTVVTGSNGYRYESAPRCLADAEYLLGDTPRA